ncbi:Tol-Pal system beta propeller repeat protein TolB [Methylovorus glucosotrophus]|uniref:Tol-Pal system protein TolB n=1 Tax=Methylovorus glucosotrophus (strain SIP3-4) TaxID=582744 RepID=C6XA95_METGS|nr:Tol-Pal system beta propeller repeat protein TolB [Methylovorus glucosotrophus]ACT51636.1 Tol-Pal system beta propeller repeat protein TolB [Methylovorus glucosotrophus SIP3-4]
MNKLRLLLSFFLLALPLAGKAALTIEIVGGAAQQIPIAVVPFAKTPGAQDDIATVVGADLRRSGLFRVLETRGVVNQPHDLPEVKYPEWAAIQAQALTIGSVETLPGGRLKVSFRLLDVLKQNQLAGLEFNIAASQQRATAHKIADIIYEKLTGEPGVFSTRIAYITKTAGRYALQVADADGFNPQTVMSSNEPVISPRWSPDGTKLAYVSYEKKKPIVFVQSLVTGQRNVVANFKGNNSAPAWSPDGNRLAIVLTHSANSQVYVINADGTGLKQLTYTTSIDTEPVWTPDGSAIYFTSSRGGGPQIYRMASTGGDAKRVTFDGNYNVSPRISPDGKTLAYIKQDNGKFRVAVQDVASGQVQVLSDTAQDESPSFAPNGRMILYATSISGRGALAAVSADGRVKQRLSETGGDVREPAWGPAAN